jgi:hypothetical protein
MKQLLIALLIVGLGVGGWFGYGYIKRNASEQTDTEPENLPEPVQPQTTDKTEQIKKIQTYMNSILPDDYPKLIVDGVYGQSSAKAFDFIQKLADDKKLSIQKITVFLAVKNLMPYILQ